MTVRIPIEELDKAIVRDVRRRNGAGQLPPDIAIAIDRAKLHGNVCETLPSTPSLLSFESMARSPRP